MSVTNGQPANAATFNAAFLSRTTDSDTTAKIDLLNSDLVNSGPTLLNIQREMNKLNSFLGSAINTGPTTTPTWINNDIGLSSDTVKLRADNLTAEFNSATGHAHSGAAGDGGLVSSLNLSNFNKYFSDWQSSSFTGAGGLSDDVTTVFSAETPGGGASAVGVPTTAPYNKLELRTYPSEDQIETAGGRKVYGRLTEAAGTWTLTYYYKDSSGVETAYSLPTQDILLYWREVFDASTRPTFGTNEGFIGSLDATADIVDATASQAGRVSISAQTFGGEKTFADGAVFQKAISTEKSDVAAGGSIAALTSTYSFVRITGTGPTDIQGITAPLTAKRIIIHNASSDDVFLKEEDAGASAANRFTLPDGADITIAQYSSAEVIYDLSAARWKIASSGSGGGGSSGFQESLGTGDGVTTTFGPLSQAPVSEASIIVSLDGLIIEDSLWSLSGSDIVFSTAPASNQGVYVWYLSNGTAAPISLTTGAVYVEEHLLTSGEITAKEFTLTNTPVSSTTVAVHLVGGSVQLKTIDYIVTGGNKINWSGLSLDGLLTAGDYLVVTYVY